MVAQLYPQALRSSGTSGVPFPIPAIVGSWGVGNHYTTMPHCPRYITFGRTVEKTLPWHCWLSRRYQETSTLRPTACTLPSNVYSSGLWRARHNIFKFYVPRKMSSRTPGCARTPGWNHCPRPPDLTQCDFYIWEYVKEQVCQPPMPQPIRQPISQAIDKVDESQLRRTWEEFEYSVDVFRVTNGAYIEYLLINFMSFRAVYKYLMFVSVTVSKIH
jgi:hypothetical protein